MDPLTEILQTLHLESSVYCQSQVTAPWGVQVPAAESAKFHIIRSGRCWLRITTKDGEEAIPLSAGDVVVLPRGQEHILSSAVDNIPTPLPELLAQKDPDVCGPLIYGGGGEPATVICGYFQFQSGEVHPLLSVLPSFIHLQGDGGRAQTWLESTLDLIYHESVSDRPGSESIVTRLTEVLFIQVIRAAVDQFDDSSQNWLRGLKDEQIGKALGLIHASPEQRWTLEELAMQVGMSRSSFATKFRLLVGEPPLQYLKRWRIHLAASHLRDQKLSLNEIAERVGYQAESAFSKVFKSVVGMAPGAFRKNHNAANPQMYS